MSCKKRTPDELAKKIRCEMGDFMPNTLKAIHDEDPDLMHLINELDEMCIHDGALDKKTKRLIALGCVVSRGCQGCIYAQATVAKNFGATKKEILEVMKICILTGGVPSWSIARKDLLKVFAEWDDKTVDPSD